MIIIDTPWNTSKQLSQLQAQGVQTIIRYYNHHNSSVLPEKCLTLAEAKAISAQGLQLAVVFQQGQNSAKDFSDQLGYAAGIRACRYAMTEMGQPVGSGIYFSVDFDATDAEINTGVIPFFEGIQRAFKEVAGASNVYRVGVYGSGATAQALLQAKLCSLVWLSMSRAFRGTKQALAAGQYDLAQTKETTLCDLSVDLNSANPARGDFGGFKLPLEQPKPVKPQKTAR